MVWNVEASRRPLEAVFDLDPGPPAAGLVDCARIAVRLRELLADLSLEAFPKTSGSLGLHVHVPLGTPHDAAETKAFARLLARVLATERPDEVVAEMRKADRPGKVYVDMSTVTPAASRELAARVRERGAEMLDAPVSGSLSTLEEGKLSIMVVA